MKIITSIVTFVLGIGTIVWLLIPIGLIFLMVYLADRSVNNISGYSGLVYTIFVAFGFLLSGFVREQGKLNKIQKRIKELKIEGAFNDILKKDE